MPFAGVMPHGLTICAHQLAMPCRPARPHVSMPCLHRETASPAWWIVMRSWHTQSMCMLTHRETHMHAYTHRCLCMLTCIHTCTCMLTHSHSSEKRLELRPRWLEAQEHITIAEPPAPGPETAGSAGRAYLASLCCFRSVIC